MESSAAFIQSLSTLFPSYIIYTKVMVYNVFGAIRHEENEIIEIKDVFQTFLIFFPFFYYYTYTLGL